MPARAQTGASAGIPMIRDAEIEQLLREYTQPILRVAGLSQQNVQVVIINEHAFNAFVMDAHRIFVISGALDAGDDAQPDDWRARARDRTHRRRAPVQMRQELANAQTAAIVAMLLGVGAMVAGARSNSMDMSQVGMAALSAPQSYLQHTLLAYQRAQEEQADRAGVRFLTATGQSAKGMYETFKHFADEIMFSSSTASIRMCRTTRCPASAWRRSRKWRRRPYWDKKDSAELQLRHDMMRAKLVRLHGAAGRGHAALSGDQYQPAGALCPRHLRLPFRRPARRDRADRRPDRRPCRTTRISTSSRAKRCSKADTRRRRSAPLRHAAELAPNPALIQIMLAQALIGTNNAKMADEAMPLLRAAIAKEPESRDAYEQLAMAYGRKGDLARCRPCLGAGGLRARRQQDRPRTRRARQDAFPGRLAGLGESRRHRRLQQEPEANPLRAGQ